VAAKDLGRDSRNVCGISWKEKSVVHVYKKIMSSAV
jgi:hypothetical protein